MTRHRLIQENARFAACLVALGLLTEITLSALWPTTVPRVASLPKPARTSCGEAWVRGDVFWTKHELPLPTQAVGDDGTVYRRTLKAKCAWVDDDGFPMPPSTSE
jgi:hypothetical protein